VGGSKEDVPPVQLQLYSGKTMSSEGLKPTPPNCQSCRVRVAAYKVPTNKGTFRWKCETCFKRLAPSGFKEKAL
jgi:hypothetical protein